MRLLERYWPWAAATILTTAWWYAAMPFPKSPDGLFGVAATVASIFASFLGVAMAILLTIKDTPTYKKLRELGRQDDLFGFLRQGITSAVVFAALSIIGFFIPDFPSWATGHAALWVFFGVASLGCQIRITEILFKLLRLV